MYGSEKKYRKIIAVFILVLLGMSVHAQKMAIRLGNSNFRDFNYIAAIEYYEFAFSKDSTDNTLIRKLAEANDRIGKTSEVEKWLKILIRRKQAEPEDYYLYAQALKSDGKYQEAVIAMNEFAELHPNDSRALMEVSMLEYIQYLMRDSTKYVIRNLSINTNGSEMGPSYYKNELVFSSTSLSRTDKERTYGWNNLPYLDMYASKIGTDGRLSSPQPFAPGLKTKYHDGPMCYDEKHDRIFYTINNFNKRSKFKKNNEEVVNLKINIAKNTERGWEYEADFQYDNPNYSVGHPSIDPTGTILYFASDMPGGYGGSDIYRSVFSDGKWGTPVNLGPKVNSEENEVFPFISNDGVLFFASNGHGGMGGLDIFFSVPEKGIFSTIENMGYPVNSSKDDFAMVLDKSGTKGYFSSNRKGGKGDDDIYALTITYIPVIIRGTVFDNETQKPLGDCHVTLINADGDTIATTHSRMNGAFEFDANRGKNYRVAAIHQSYSGDQKKVTTMGLRPNQEVDVDFYLERMIAPAVLVEKSTIATNTGEYEVDEAYPEPLKIEEENGEIYEVLELEYIDFDSGSWKIQPDAAETLNRILSVIAKYPDLEIRIESHTDSKGSDEDNLLLSKNRANSAAHYFEERGVDVSKIKAEGYGETHLLNKCANGVDCSEEEHAVNRRTIVKVVKKGVRRKRGQRGIFYF